MINQEKNELIDIILTYLDTLRNSASAARRNGAYVKGIRDSMKIIQSFKDIETENENPI